LCEAFCKASDYEYYIYAVIRSVTSLSSPQVHTYTNYPDEWFKSYLEEGMQKHDPVVKYCFENSAPICWNKLIQLESYVDPIGFKIMERAAELGLVNGISIPLKAPHGEMAIFSLATEKPEQTGEPLLEVLSHAQTLGTQLMAKVRRINTD